MRRGAFKGGGEYTISGPGLYGFMPDEGSGNEAAFQSWFPTVPAVTRFLPSALDR